MTYHWTYRRITHPFIQDSDEFDVKEKLEALQFNLRRVSIGGAVFFGTGQLCSGFVALFEKLHVPQPFQTVFAFLLSILILFWFLYKFGARFFNVSNDVTEHVEDEKLIATVFDKLSLRRPRVVWVPRTAMVCGIVGAVPFLTKILPPPSLIVSEHWRKNLTSDEFKMVVAHEAAHAKMAHIPFRMLFTAIALFFAQLGIFTSFFSFTLFFDNPHPALYSCLFAALPVFIIFGLPYCRFLRSQETEADLRAVYYFPENKNDLIQALEKTQSLIGSRKKLIQTHPSMSHRIQALLTYNPKAKPKSSLRSALFATGLHGATFALLLGLLAFKSATALELRSEIEKGSPSSLEAFIQNRNPRLNQFTFGIPFGSPLLLAVKMKNPEAVKILTRYGANPDLNYSLQSGSARDLAVRLKWNEGLVALGKTQAVTRSIASGP